MAKRKGPTKRQKAVIDDMLVDGSIDESEVFARHGISAAMFSKWLGDEKFVAELNARMRSAHLKSNLIIARYSHIAAMKLVELTGCEKEETARKACLDIISLPIGEPDGKVADKQSNNQAVCDSLTPEMARKLLGVLAGKDEKG